jgi:Kef-type K+ transport system membrane component KefB
MAVEQAAFLHIVLSLGILLFAAKLLAELFHRIKMPIVLGELLAGIIVGPFALGGLPFFDGKPLVVLDETVRHIGELSAVVILFIAGLEITPREFVKGGAASFTVGGLGVVVPFFVGYFVFVLFGLQALESMLVATALTATSIAISIQVLTQLGKMQSKEAKLILGAAIVDDILAIAVLSVVTCWMRYSFIDVFKRQNQIIESWNRHDFKRRSRFNCSRRRSYIRSAISRYLYCCHYNGSGNYSCKSYMA